MGVADSPSTTLTTLSLRIFSSHFCEKFPKNTLSPLQLNKSAVHLL